MIEPLRRGAVALAGVLLASGALGLVDAPEVAARAVAGACTTTTGVTVIVDFGSTGGGVQTRCAPAPVKSGFEALTKAGFTITNVSSQPGFLCQIDGKPADEPCNHVPSASRYWSYWYADRGEPWTFSSSGASRKPPPGSVEGWSFGASDPPGANPPGPITTTTTRPSATTTTAAPATSTSGAGSADDPSVTTASTEADDISASTTTTAMGAAEDADADDEAQALGPSDVARSDEARSSPAGVVAAGLVVVALGAGAIRIARRRAVREADA